MSTAEHERAVAALDRLYTAVPELECRGLCWPACKQVPMSAVEEERIERFRGPIGEYAEDGTCPMLTADHRCGVYDIRPLVCRVWGASEMFVCPYGCATSRFLTRQETHELMAESEKIGGRSQTQFERVQRSVFAGKE